MPAAVIFDVDGTLVDTVDFHAEAWQRVFAEFGHDIPFADLRSQIGKGGDQFLPVFLDQAEIERNGKVIEDRRAELIKAEYLPKVRGFPGVRDLFLKIKSDGMRIALASSAKSDELAVYKKAANIEDLIDVETSSDDAERSKPHPDIFQAALDRLQLGSEDVVVVGDTPFDAQAAGKAGIQTIGVLCGGFPEDALRAAGASEIFRDPADFLSRYGMSRLLGEAGREVGQSQLAS